MMYIGDKLRFLREKLGLTQEQLAYGICSKSLISKIENNHYIPNDALLCALRERLGVEAAISPIQVKALKNKLYAWYNLIKNRQIEEASKIQSELKLAVNYSNEFDLEIFYELFEIRLLLSSFNENKDVLKDKFGDLLKKRRALSDEQQYYFFFFYGFYKNALEEFHEALSVLIKAEEFGKALRLQESDFYSIKATVLSRLAYHPKAVIYGTVALEISKNPDEQAYLIEIEITLAISYNRIGEYERAEALLNNALNLANLKNDINLILICYHNLACTFCKLKMFDKSMRYFEIALAYCEPNEYSYVNNILWVAYMLLEKGDVATALKWIDKGIPLAKNFKNLHILLKSVQYSENLSESNSLIYLENTTIPFLQERGMLYEAIEYADKLKNFYRTKKMYKEALRHSELAKSLYKTILSGEA